MTNPEGTLPAGVPALPLKADHLAERVVDGELVLYDPQRQYVHALNPTAAFVWRGCDGEHDVASIIAELAELYPGSRQAIEEDVVEILKQFQASGLLRA